MPADHPRPFILDADPEPAPARVAARPPAPEAARPFVVEDAPAAVRLGPMAPVPMEGPTAEPAGAVAVPPPPRQGLAGGLLLSGITLLAALGLGLEGSALLTWLFAQHWLLGLAGAAGLGLAAAGLLALSWGELRALARTSSIDGARAAGLVALRSGSLAEARAVVARLETLHRPRPDLAWALARFDERRDDILDGPDLLRLYEQEVLVPLDRAAVREIVAAARANALLTAISPYVVFDALIVGWRNLMLLRRIARLYGGRPGRMGTFSLMRRTIGYVTLTGGLEAADGVIGNLLGGGLAGAVSARLGQGVVNGALTARLGLAAIELTRPLPRIAAERPRLVELAGKVLADLRRVF